MCISVTVHRKTREGAGSLDARVIGSCELTDGGYGKSPHS